MAVKITGPDGQPVETLMLSSGIYKAAELDRPEDLPEPARFYLARKGYKITPGPTSDVAPDETWSRDALLEHAHKQGVDMPGNASKAEILTALHGA